MMKDQDFRLIDTAAKDGQPKVVRRGPDYARAFWTGGDRGMWAYDFGPDSAAKHQIDFEPTHYAPIHT
jgi:hypothetical protein